jgi:ribosomal protein S18 acetylase RimI-like enzyme
VDTPQVLAQYDLEMRLRPGAHGSDRIEESGRVIRVVGDDSWIPYSRLDSTSAVAAIREQTDFFRALGRKVEWKVFGHDTPSNLGGLLGEAGYVPDPTETLVAFDLSGRLETGLQSPDLEIRQINDADGLSIAVGVSEQAFGSGVGWSRHTFAGRLTDPAFGVFVAYIHGEPVSAGRLEMPRDRSFASLWGGGTAPRFRGQGIYRALVAARADVARRRGYRYLTVDALPTSRPILERLGFEPLTTVTGWVYDPSKAV